MSTLLATIARAALPRRSTLQWAFGATASRAPRDDKAKLVCGGALQHRKALHQFARADRRWPRYCTDWLVRGIRTAPIATA